MRPKRRLGQASTTRAGCTEIGLQMISTKPLENPHLILLNSAVSSSGYARKVNRGGFPNRGKGYFCCDAAAAGPEMLCSGKIPSPHQWLSRYCTAVSRPYSDTVKSIILLLVSLEPASTTCHCSLWAWVAVALLRIIRPRPGQCRHSVHTWPRRSNLRTDDRRRCRRRRTTCNRRCRRSLDSDFHCRGSRDRIHQGCCVPLSRARLS